MGDSLRNAKQEARLAWIRNMSVVESSATHARTRKRYNLREFG